MKNPLVYSIIFLLFSYSLSAQISGGIEGTVIDTDGQAIDAANVLLMSAADSSMVKLELSNEQGYFFFRGAIAGNYWLRVSYVGMPAYNSEVFEWAGSGILTLEQVIMQPSAAQLEEVTVTAQRPLLELKADKMVFNVDGSINAVGSDALELLRKSPGVVVDNNDNIILQGNNGVQVFIDGKPSPLSDDDLAAYLKSIQSSEVDQIEIITNPSAKYDAQGSGGIINIKMKRDKRHGANANLNLGYAVGRKSRYNGSLSSNYRNKAFNVFSSYSYNSGENWNFFDLYREQSGLVFDQNSLSGGDNTNHNFKAGTDYFIDKHQTLGLMVDGFVSDFNWQSNSNTRISRLNQAVDSVLQARSFTVGDRANVNFNLNYRFDNGKTTWSLDGSYGLFRNDRAEDQPNQYFDPTETELLNEFVFRTISPTDIDIYAFKADHERPLGKGKLSTGLKVAYVETDNDFQFYNMYDGEGVLNQQRSNHFVYQENVNAAYVNYQQQIKKFGFQAGLRMENTNSEGDLTSFVQTNNNKVDTSYLNFFPSAGITYQLNDKNSLQLTYSRRINRPSYQDLNPFVSQLDELTFEKGNPFLRPEYTNSFKLTHTLNYAINTSFGFSHTKDMIVRFTDTDAGSGNDKAAFITWRNLQDQFTYSLNISAALPVKPWWNSYTNISGSYTHNEGNFGIGRDISINVPSFNLYSQHTFRLPKDISFELSGWYNSRSIWGGTFETDPMWSLDAGIQKKIWDGRGNIKISVSDIFRTTNWSGLSETDVLYLRTNGGWDSRRLRLNFSYLFGNSNVKGSRRKAGLEEEQKRIKGDN